MNLKKLLSIATAIAVTCASIQVASVDVNALSIDNGTPILVTSNDKDNQSGKLNVKHYDITQHGEGVNVPLSDFNATGSPLVVPVNYGKYVFQSVDGSINLNSGFTSSGKIAPLDTSGYDNFQQSGLGSLYFHFLNITNDQILYNGQVVWGGYYTPTSTGQKNIWCYCG